MKRSTSKEYDNHRIFSLLAKAKLSHLSGINNVVSCKCNILSKQIFLFHLSLFVVIKFNTD